MSRPSEWRRLIGGISVAMMATGLIVIAAACGGPAAAPAATTAPAAPAAPAATKAAAPAAATTAPAAPAATKPAAAAPAAPAAGAKVAKLASVLPEDHPQQKAYLFFADKVKEYTNGALTIQIFANSQLGQRARVC